MDDRPMRVALVRLATPDCEPSCPEWLAASGRIDASTPAVFRRALARLGKRRVPVLVESRGGSVNHALTVGRMIRAKGLDVVVSKTVVTPCAPADVSCRKLAAAGTQLGRPEARISICASSCAFILAGGVKRYVGPWTLVGLHEIKSTTTLRRFQRLYKVERRYSWGVPVEVRRTLIKERTLSTQVLELETDEKTYERVRSFFSEMGVSEQIMPILRSAPNSSIRWLRATELRTTGIATDLVNGEQLLLPQAVAAAPAAPLTPGATAADGTVIGAAPARPAEAPCRSVAGTSLMTCTTQVGQPIPAPAPATPAVPTPNVPAAAVPAQPTLAAAPPPPATAGTASPITTSSITPAATAPAQPLPDRPAAKAAVKAKPKSKPRPARTASPAPSETRLPLGFQ
jgi:hypothetical protein